MIGSKSGRVLVSQETLNRNEVVRDFNEGRLSRKEAASAIGKSERQFSRMVKRWRTQGVLGLEHGLVGRKSLNCLSEESKELVLGLLKGKYFGFNLKHFHEHLIDVEKIYPILSYASVKRLAREAGLGSTKRRRTKIRKRRNRFSQEGYMFQMDGSTHFWWKGREMCLIAGIDDATSNVPYGEFFETETLEGYIRVLRRVIELKGIPRIIYVDRASWLSGISDEEKGQFHRMCEELGTRVIHAHSAEAKGRVERLWGTLQDRLVSEFRLHGTDSAEKANQYLNQIFLTETWSKKFTLPASKSGELYRPRPQNQDLNQIFCLKLDRKIRKDHTILFGNEIYGITADLGHSIARRIADIRIYSDGSVRGYYGGKDLELKLERKQCWEKVQDRKARPGLTAWHRVLGRDFQVNTGS